MKTSYFLLHALVSSTSYCSGINMFDYFFGMAAANADTQTSPSVSRQECSNACADEFVKRCVPFQENSKRISRGEAYTECLRQLQDQVGPITNACNDPSCKPSASMLAVSSDSGDGNINGNSASERPQGRPPLSSFQGMGNFQGPRPSGMMPGRPQRPFQGYFGGQQPFQGFSGGIPQANFGGQVGYGGMSMSGPPQRPQRPENFGGLPPFQGFGGSAMPGPPPRPQTQDNFNGGRQPPFQGFQGSVSSSGQECSIACSNEFVNRCVPFQENSKGISRGEAYSRCLRQLQDQVGPLANVCNDPGCTPTPSMLAAHDTSSPPPFFDGPNQGDGGGVSTPVTSKPTSPEICSPENQGRCECGDPTQGTTTYTFWINNIQRCFSVYVPVNRAFENLPVVMHMQCYARDRLNGIGMRRNSAEIRAADTYGFALFGLSTPDGNWEFGNDGVVNDANPQPCSDNDSKDIPYLKAILSFIEANAQQFNQKKVYTEGFSQNSMMAAYSGFCFPEKIAGIWQGGSGLSLTGSLPHLPQMEGQCAASAFDMYKRECVVQAPCLECQYWPIYPCYTPQRPMVDCIAEYTNDGVSVDRENSEHSTAKYMHEKLVDEGHDSRLLRFSPTSTTQGGHKDPQNSWAWKVGCLGITSKCSSECVASFAMCVDSQSLTASPSAFKECLSEPQFSSLPGCVQGCAPTLEMLKKSEVPDITLSKGVWGERKTASELRPSNSKCTSASNLSPLPFSQTNQEQLFSFEPFEDLTSPTNPSLYNMFSFGDPVNF